MIDFRYHLVSIIAVFLALAIGLAIGANLLPAATEVALSKAASAVTRQNKNLTQQNKILQQQVSADQSFAQASERRLLGGLLAHQSVVLVTAPGYDSQVVNRVTTAVQDAGGTVNGQVSLQSPFFDGSDSAEARLIPLAQSLAPNAGVTLPSPPASNAMTGQEDAARVIAAAIVSRNGIGLTPAQSQTILSGFGQSGYLQIVSGNNGNATTLAPATMAIVVAPATPPTSNDSSPANLALIAMAQQLQAASRQTVLIGSLSGSGPGSAIAYISGAGKVSTVDDADQAVGQILTVQALWELLTGHSPASYGVASGVVPSPAPTSSASPPVSATANPAHHVRKKK